MLSTSYKKCFFCPKYRRAFRCVTVLFCCFSVCCMRNIKSNTSCKRPRHCFNPLLNIFLKYLYADFSLIVTGVDNQSFDFFFSLNMSCFKEEEALVTSLILALLPTIVDDFLF